MTALHASIANALVLFYALVGLWGVGLGMLKRPLDSAYRGALVLAVVTACVQVGVGLVLLVVVGLPRDPVHLLYGMSLVITLPLVRQYLAGQHLPPPMAYGLGCLFMAGLALRAITTGR